VQAQPTADEVKEEIIQPLADKVKAEAVPAAERLTREQLQPAAEQAAQQLDAGAQQLTEEVMKPAAEVGAVKLTIRLLKCPLDRCGAVQAILRLVLPHAWNAALPQAADTIHCHICELLAILGKALDCGRRSVCLPISTAPSEAVLLPCRLLRRVWSQLRSRCHSTFALLARTLRRMPSRRPRSLLSR
jgi:hypothetical protein